MTLRWTNEKPTEPGFWFHRWLPKDTEDLEVEAVEIERQPNSALYVCAYLNSGWLDRIGGQWAGPIPEPLEPEPQEA